MQLDHFLPRYCEAVALRSEDVYGVFPWYARTSSSGADGGSSTAWDDFWIVYRDRPDYEAGRDSWAKQMDKKGRWPDPVIAPGVGEAEGSSSGAGKVKVEKSGWPRKALVMKQKYDDLSKSVLGKIEKWGYEPKDSYGFCPNFQHRSIYFGWRD